MPKTSTEVAAVMVLKATFLLSRCKTGSRMKNISNCPVSTPERTETSKSDVPAISS